MTTSEAIAETASGWNEAIVNLLVALGSGHTVRTSGASSLMIYRGKELAAEVQLGEPITVAVWLTIRVGSEADCPDDPALRESGETALEDVLPVWAAKDFRRSTDEYLDQTNPDDPTVVFVARLDALSASFDDAVALVHWALEQARKFDVRESR